MNVWSREPLKSAIDSSLSQTFQEKQFFENHIVRSLLLADIILLLAIFALLFWFIRPSEVLSVLHYNVYFGVDLLGAWWQTFVFPALSLIFVCIDIGLAYQLYTRQHERIAAYIVLLGSSMLLSGTLLGCVAIVYVNY